MAAAGMRFAWPPGETRHGVSMRIDAGSYLYQNGQAASATAASSKSLATAPGNTPSVESAATNALSSGIIKTG